MSFTYDLSTDVGLLRLEIQDTSEAQAAFSDQELAVFLAREGSVGLAAVAAVDVLIVDRARRQRMFNISGAMYDDRGAVSALREARALLVQRYPRPFTVSWGGRVPSDRRAR